MKAESSKIHVMSLIIFCVAANLSVGAVVRFLKLPIYLDSIGTFFSAALAGWLIGAIVGAITLIFAIFLIAPTMPAYIGTAIVIALSVSFLCRKTRFLSSPITTVLGGILVGILAALASAPVTAFVYGGVSLAGADFVVAFFSATGQSLINSVLFGGLSTDPVDKIMTALVTLALIKAMPSHILIRFKFGKQFISDS